jgi:hypothetical protein
MLSAYTGTMLLSQLSVTVTVAAAGMASHSKVPFAGTPAITGAIASPTLIN